MRLIEKLLRKNWTLYIFSRYIYNIIFVKFFFEPECEIFDFLKFKRKLIIIDVGSSDGSFSKNLSKKFYKSKFYCFEPLNSFHKNFKLYNNNNLKIFDVGCSTGKGITKIYTPYKKVFNKNFYLKFFSSIEKKSIYFNIKKYLNKDKFYFNYHVTDIKLRSLDSFKLKPNIIKIDVEGYEHYVIKGSIKTIKKYYPLILIENPSSNIDKILYKLGYDKYQYSQGDKKLKKIFKNNSKSYNYLFVNKKKNFLLNKIFN
jgi:FkbM family methyltransferase